jgi:hypothetical protein
MKKNNYFLLCLYCVIISCTRISDDEKTALEKLRGEFARYDFEKISDVSDAYIRVILKDARADSLELKVIYNYAMSIDGRQLNDSTNLLHWKYLVVYSQENKYMFTIVEDQSSIIFFESEVR